MVDDDRVQGHMKVSYSRMPLLNQAFAAYQLPQSVWMVNGQEAVIPMVMLNTLTQDFVAGAQLTMVDNS